MSGKPAILTQRELARAHAATPELDELATLIEDAIFLLRSQLPKEDKGDEG